MPARNPDERALIAQMAAATRWGRSGTAENRAAATQPARDGLRRRFEIEADPHRVLSDAERAARVDQLLHAHMLRMSLKAAAGRRRKREAEQQIREAETALVELGGGAA